MIETKLYTAHDFREMPWKSGDGMTLQLAISPSDANLSAMDFLWRLSIATVHKSGPFSLLHGYNRSLTLLEGKGMRLDCGSHGTFELINPFESLDFPGDWPVDCSLIDGTVRDFNVMTKRGECDASVSFYALRPQSGDSSVALPEISTEANQTVLIYCLAGAVSFDEHRCSTHELLQIDGSVGGTLQPLDEAEACVICIKLTRCP